MRNPAFTALVREIEALHETKNHDYADNGDPLSNLRRAESFGIPAWKGVMVRLSDKWSRLEQLAAGKTPKHESIRDSLIDNAVYSLLAILLLDEQSVTYLKPHSIFCDVSPGLDFSPCSDPNVTTVMTVTGGAQTIAGGASNGSTVSIENANRGDEFGLGYHHALDAPIQILESGTRAFNAEVANVLATAEGYAVPHADGGFSVPCGTGISYTITPHAKAGPK